MLKEVMQPVSNNPFIISYDERGSFRIMKAASIKLKKLLIYNFAPTETKKVLPSAGKAPGPG
jgi:hypothetical protein